MLQNNPFLTEGYLSPEYFCDRVEETALLTRHILQTDATWHSSLHDVWDMLYTHAISESTITTEDAKSVMTTILSHHRFVYESLLFQLSPKQKQVLLAIANEGNATGVTSQAFLQKYKLGSSTVQGAIKVLTERDFISYDNDSYQVSDRFFREWIIKRF